MGTARSVATPGQRAGQPLGVERQVGDDVAAGPAGQQAGLARTAQSARRVDGADQPPGRGLEQVGQPAASAWHPSCTDALRARIQRLSAARDRVGDVADQLIIRGAREHNLKDVSLDLPRDSLIVFTGLSGSGKSSLAFDTIFAEGQRRYVESLSAYARQFLGQMDKPDVDFIEGLSPAVSIDQKSTSKNPRSTVGTITEVYDYLRLLYARAGRPHCPVCGAPIERQTPQQIVDRVLDPRGGRPVPGARAGDPRPQGRVRRPVPAAADPGLLPGPGRRRDPPARRPAEARQAEEAHHRGGRRPARGQGSPPSGGSPTRSRPRSAWPAAWCIFDFVDLRRQGPATASCGSPRRWRAPTTTRSTPTSSSRGRSRSTRRSAPARSATASAPGWRSTPSWSSPTRRRPSARARSSRGAWPHVADYFVRLLGALGEELGFDLDTPWEDLPAEGAEVAPRRATRPRSTSSPRNRYGRERVLLRRLRGRPPLHRAPAPRGRVRHQPGAVRGLHARGAVPGLRAAAGSSRCRWRSPSAPRTRRQEHRRGLRAADQRDRRASCATSTSAPASARSASGCSRRSRSGCSFLLDVGLDYLSLDRPSGSLSGGEAQRIRLATQIGAGLVGVLYVLDEPSIGLHQRDNQRLIETLVRLKDLGNTLIVVEHDEDTIRTADWVVDIGPGAGEHGGQVVALRHGRGPARAPRLDHRRSTSPAAARSRSRPSAARAPPGRELTVLGAREHNLQDIDVALPARAVRRGHRRLRLRQVDAGQRHPLHLAGQADLQRPHGARAGTGRSPASSTSTRSSTSTSRRSGARPRSNPATYTGVFDHIRKLFASTPEAKMRGYLQGRFSFNVKGGRCEACSGDGTIKIEMNFLPGRLRPVRGLPRRPLQPRDARGALQGQDHRRGPRHADRGGGRVLRGGPGDRPAHEDAGRGRPRLRPARPAGARRCPAARRSGSSSSSELQKRSTGRTVYVLDEPTTGLHFEDIRKLLLVLGRLVDQGNTVLVIEHNLDVIKTADWIVDMGPEGGSRGGTVVAEGTPEDVAANPEQLHRPVPQAAARRARGRAAAAASRPRRRPRPRRRRQEGRRPRRRRPAEVRVSAFSSNSHCQPHRRRQRADG